MFVELAESDLYCAIEPEKSSKEYANWAGNGRTSLVEHITHRISDII